MRGGGLRGYKIMRNIVFLNNNNEVHSVLLLLIQIIFRHFQDIFGKERIQRKDIDLSTSQLLVYTELRIETGPSSW